MICVTGASGTLGSEVVRQLQAADVPFRAAYFSGKKAEDARARGIDVVVIDYNDPATLRTAFEGCDKLFLLGPNLPNQTELEIGAVEAAKAAGVRHIVKQSVMSAEGEAYSLAHIHRAVEKAIEASGLDWTFLRPNSFMQNAVTFMAGTIQSDSAFYSSAGGDAKIAHVDIRDIAAVAVKALTEPGHEGKAYTLTGPETISYDELASKLSEVVGRQINHVNLSHDDLKGAMLGQGMPEKIADVLLDLDRFYREGHASGITGDIKKVTGTDPRKFDDYIRETAPTGVWDAASQQVSG